MSKKKGKKKRGQIPKRTKTKKSTRGPQIPSGYSTAIMEHGILENPLKGLREDQRNKLAVELGTDAETQFRATFTELESLVRRHQPDELLAAAAFYCLFKGVGPDTDFTDDGPYPQTFIEVLQSVCLRPSPEEFDTRSVLQPDLARILELTKECSTHFALNRMASSVDAESPTKALILAIEGARHQTQILRNWGTPQHMRRIIQGLLTPLDSEISDHVGVGPLALLKLVDALHEQSCRQGMEFINSLRPALGKPTLRGMVRGVCELTGADEGDAENLFELMRSRPGTREGKQGFLLSYFHQQMPQLFVVTAEDCIKLVADVPEKDRWDKLLHALSLQFGDLATENPEHLMMQSKIRTKPIIRLAEETYFLPILGLLNSFFIEIVETLIRSNAGLKKRYHKRRAVYLEEMLLTLLTGAFPGCLVRAGTTGISPLDSKEYENDCLVVVGPIALVFEGKSERVDDVARRGGEETLKDHYETLVAEPAKQAERFALLLETGEGKKTFQTKKHGSYELDLSQIRRAICISVTLDWLPATTLCWRQLLSAGLVNPERRPAINLSLSDFMVALEVLSSPVIRLHYFCRRSEWEQKVDYAGDEEDALVYYLSEGLTSLKSTNDGDETCLWLYGNSNELRRFYMAEWVNPKTKVPPPRRLLTSWWRSLLEKVESRPDPHRWDIGLALLDLSFEQQKEFERAFNKTVARVRTHGNDCGQNAVICSGCDSESRAAVVGYAYRRLPTAERNARATDLAMQAQEDGQSDRVIIIGRDVERMGDPYDFLGFVDGPPKQSSDH